MIEKELYNSLSIQKNYYKTGITKDITFRINALQHFKSILLKEQSKIYKALKVDLHKSEFETYATELGIVLEEISLVTKNLKKWMKPKRVRTPLTNFKGSSWIYNEPYGKILIISPWNYPLNLTFLPLIGAIAAGNTVILKPSEQTPTIAATMQNIIRKAFEPGLVNIFLGDYKTSQILLDQKWDYIFFTGSPLTGRFVMEAAAKHLTPVTLELGGKNPAIVDEDANLEIAAKRIIWGKMLNAGQTCVAPNHVFAHKKIKNKLLKLMVSTIIDFFGDRQELSSDYGRIATNEHLLRLEELIKPYKPYYGGKSNSTERYFSPTILDDIKADSHILRDEIFGPILPVVEFENFEEMISNLKLRHKPLAVYYFSENKNRQKIVIKASSSGSTVINDTVMQLANPFLPFGGVGNSGIGSYHGKFSFKTFSNQKSVLKKSTFFDTSLRYPPYTEKKLSMIKKFWK